mgnify:CR=1 FL=1
MTIEHCKNCKPGQPCGNGHLYVIEFKKDVEVELKNKSVKGYLYVGSTNKSVEERFEDNFIKIDGSWKYNTPNTRRIRKYFLQFKPDLFYYENNPIVYDKNDKKSSKDTKQNSQIN